MLISIVGVLVRSNHVLGLSAARPDCPYTPRASDNVATSPKQIKIGRRFCIFPPNERHPRY